jgi:hypothetical protein
VATEPTASPATPHFLFSEGGTKAATQPVAVQRKPAWQVLALEIVRTGCGYGGDRMLRVVWNEVCYEED